MGYFFALLSYAFYATVNYVDKFVLQKYEINPTVISVYTGFFAIFSSILIILFTGFHRIDLQSAVIIILSGILTELYMLPYFKSLKIDEASRIIPLFQLTPVIVIFLSFFFLHETLLPKQYLGSFFIIAASFFLTIEKVELKIFKIRTSLWYMLLAGLLYAIAIFLFKIGLKHEILFWTALPYEGLGVLIGSILILCYKNNFQLFKKMTKNSNRKVFIYIPVNDIIFIASRYLQYFALTFLSVSVVSILGGFQPLFALIYGLILSLCFPKILQEVISKKTVTMKLTAIITIFAGLYFIFL